MLMNRSLLLDLRSFSPLSPFCLPEKCVDRFDLIGCQAADEFCGEHLYLYMNLGRNPYDISKVRLLAIPDVWTGSH